MPNCSVWHFLPLAREILFLEESISLHLVHNTVQAVGVNVDNCHCVQLHSMRPARTSITPYVKVFENASLQKHLLLPILMEIFCHIVVEQMQTICLLLFREKMWTNCCYSRSGGRSGRRVCLSRLSCLINNSKLTWYLISQCHHSCGYAECRQPDLEVKNRHFNQAEAVYHLHSTYFPVWLWVLGSHQERYSRLMPSISGVCESCWESRAEWLDEMDNWATTPVSYCPSTASFSARPHCKNARRVRCQEYHNCFPFGELQETTRMSSYYMDEDYPARPDI